MGCAIFVQFFYKQEEVNDVFHWLLRHIFVGPFLRYMVRAKVSGRENLPKHGPYLLAIGSHKTEVESGVLSVYLRSRPLHFYAKAEYWHKNRLFAWLMTGIKQIPMDRTDAAKADEAISLGAELLRQGEIVAVYPEGTRSPDDKVHGGYPSFVNSVIRAGGKVPIIPVGLKHFESVSPDGSGLFPRHRGEVEIIIGKPIWLSKPEMVAVKSLNARLQSHGDHRRARVLVEGPIARRITKVTMARIAELSGKSQVSKRLSLTGESKV